MAKFLFALTKSESFNENLFGLTKDLYGNMNKHLFVGLIVKDLTYKSAVNEFVEKTIPFGIQSVKNKGLTEEDQEKADVISICEKKAKKNKIRCEIYNDFHLTVQEVINQTKYADLLILSYQIFFNFSNNKPDSSLLYQVLKGSKCPVMILPDNICKIDNIIFTYDGKDSSVFAIRAFSNLFAGHSKNKPISILTVMKSPDDDGVKNEKLLMELIKQHFNDVGIQLLGGNSISKEISNFAGTVTNPLIVMGAYGRSRVSNILLPSVARHIMTNSRLSLFIAHR